jgi:hypothetical protein
MRCLSGMVACGGAGSTGTLMRRVSPDRLQPQPQGDCVTAADASGGCRG